MTRCLLLPDLQEKGRDAFRMISELYPLCRSITGNGLRQTLRMLRQRIPLELREVPSGTQVFDWAVPKEWNIRDAYVKNSRGQKVIDFKQNNLHLVNYSVPVHRKLSLAELKKHLYCMDDHPDWIPYKTTYYKETWGFCLRRRDLDQFTDGEYEVYIDSDLQPGHLTYGELVLPGKSSDEVLFSCHTCHPSLCNDNLSGVAMATLLAEHLQQQSRRYTYRFLFVPGTIGAITWLARNRESVDRIRYGLVLTGLGDPGPVTYKKSRIGDAAIDRSVSLVLSQSGRPHSVLDFSPYGYDERQYCSPGFNLPVGRLSRTPFGEYPEYHSSADNLDFVQPAALAESFGMLWDIVQVIEKNGVYKNMNPFCEPQLGRRGLYESKEIDSMALLWVLNLSDGHRTLLEIAERSGLKFAKILAAKEILARNQLLQEMEALL